MRKHHALTSTTFQEKTLYCVQRQKLKLVLSNLENFGCPLIKEVEQGICPLEINELELEIMFMKEFKSLCQS